MADAKLKPCPFCGGKASLRERAWWVVSCENRGCWIRPTTAEDEDKARVIRTWNTRKRPQR